MKTLAFAFTLTFAQLSFAQDQTQPAPLGGPGESCRARADCGGELKCINNKCSTVADARARVGSDIPDAWMKFSATDGAIHPYAGIMVGGGFDTIGLTGALSGGFDTFDGAFLFALEGGVFIGQNQISLEIAPYTFIYDGKANGPVFEANASYAYLIPLTDIGNIHLFWPLRIGAGILAGGDNSYDLAFFQLRADVLGFAAHMGHAVVEFHLPSFRYAITDKGVLNQHAQIHLLDWVFGISAGYAF